MYQGLDVKPSTNLLTSIRILLAQVQVTCKASGACYQLPCDRWLRADKASGPAGCRVELLPGQAPASGQASYKVVVATTDVRGAGTDADISVTLYGDRGDSGPLVLESSANNFERAKVDCFFVKVGGAAAVLSHTIVWGAAPYKDAVCDAGDGHVWQAGSA
jgi:hypothetical protein